MIAKKEKSMTLKLEMIWSFALTLFFAIKMNYHLSKSSVVWYGTLALVIFAYILVYNGRFRLDLSPFLVWLLFFTAFGVLSLLWSLSISAGVDVIKSLIVVFAVLFLIQLSIYYGYKIDTLLKCYFISTLINIVYIFLTVDVRQLGEEQLGTGLLEGWNGNGIGFMAAQGVLIGIYLLNQCKNRAGKIIYFVSVVVLALMTMYTGSRTAFIVMVVGMVIYFWLSHPTKLLKNMFVTALVACVAFYLIMNVEVFYNVLGSRFEGLFAIFGAEGTADSSATVRNKFIENGIEWFCENPFCGYGINNYKVLNVSATGRFTYAHNNFIEIAVDLGVVGLILYYSIYVYIIVKLFKTAKKDPLTVFLVSALIASVISHYGNVAYYELYQNLLLLLCFCWLKTKTQKSAHT